MKVSAATESAVYKKIFDKEIFAFKGSRLKVQG